MAAILNRRVLVLNQSYEPLMVIGARRAIILLLSEKVESLENYREIIHSVYLSMPLPSVIKLKEYARIRRKEIVLSRKNILKRDNHTCQYCGKKSVPMTIDHIISRNKGGQDSWDNLVAACVPCNTKKRQPFFTVYSNGFIQDTPKADNDITSTKICEAISEFVATLFIYAGE